MLHCVIKAGLSGCSLCKFQFESPDQHSVLGKSKIASKNFQIFPNASRFSEIDAEVHSFFFFLNVLMFWLKSTQTGWTLYDKAQAAEEGRKTKRKGYKNGKSVYRGRPRKGGGKQYVEEGLPQVLQRQMEKQLIQVQGNRPVISSSLKTFIKTLTKVAWTKRKKRMM